MNLILKPTRWMFKVQAQLISIFHGCTVFPAMVFPGVIFWSGNAPSLQQQDTWLEPWPCCVQTRPSTGIKEHSSFALRT